MSSNDSFTASTTSFQYAWPESITGIERVLLSANGDLQRVLSAFFAKPIEAEILGTSSNFGHVETLKANDVVDETHSKPDSYSEPASLTQKRSINLLCDGVVVCHAKSVVVASSPKAMELLKQGYFLGQITRILQQIPQFSLKEVNVWTEVEGGSLVDGTSPSQTTHSTSAGNITADGSQNHVGRVRLRMSRRYNMQIDGLVCDIHEFFPDRTLFAGL
ncbi:hypothetical protein BKA62DRAFT_245660 [Auriculariales sp. MPI-PUGE-AT-0066]|nr:hypothetical protein BKA62DRAFT_245660 [Auriculariales sp. MPI-PUGE-AT-0066]